MYFILDFLHLFTIIVVLHFALGILRILFINLLFYLCIIIIVNYYCIIIILLNCYILLIIFLIEVHIIFIFSLSTLILSRLCIRFRIHIFICLIYFKFLMINLQFYKPPRNIIASWLCLIAVQSLLIMFLSTIQMELVKNYFQKIDSKFWVIIRLVPLIFFF